MKPDPGLLLRIAPGLDERLLEEHLGRLDDAYFDAFTPEQVAAHVGALGSLSPEQPAAVLTGDGSVTILGFDHDSAFSLICGILASSGFAIVAGDVFTYGPPTKAARARHQRDALGRPYVDPYRRRRIVDHFTGLARPGFDQLVLVQRIEQTLALLEADATAEARRRVNSWVPDYLRLQPGPAERALFPVQIRTAPRNGSGTRLFVTSQDTPGFLYAFSTGLSLQGVSIDRVRIATQDHTVQDEIDVSGPGGQPLSGDGLDSLRACAILTKHFTYFLDRAPDPSAALQRFNLLVRDLFQHRGEATLDQLVDPEAMRGLARLLGASDFIWEDFVRVQYEGLLPFLHPRPEGQPLSAWLDQAGQRLAETLAAAESFEDKRRRLNAYKDHEAFMIDLEHILTPDADDALDRLSARLTSLAERVVDAAAKAVAEELAARRGAPGTDYAVLGLGKLGGAALGYASDLELLFVYREPGWGEFYAALVQGVLNFIQAKQDGLFQIDLKLRPHGIDGPLATSLQAFQDYYGPGGPAHSMERLSLTRLRAIGGDAALGTEVERARDQLLYEVPSISLDELRTTRLLQFEQKSRPGSYNAKYSPGALVDVEYAAEILQILYGKNHPEVRSPRTPVALRALHETEVISASDLDQLLGAYEFLGRLINGLRMLRGWADDLFLPAADSEEFAHLARRMGYEGNAGITASQQLDVEFQSRTAAVRAFVERRFGPSGLPGPVVANLADLVLSDSLPMNVRERVLTREGFRDPSSAYANLRRLAGNDERRLVFARLAGLACQVIGRLGDPDAALDRWRRQVDELPDPESRFRELLADPRGLSALFPAEEGMPDR